MPVTRRSSNRLQEGRATALSTKQATQQAGQDNLSPPSSRRKTKRTTSATTKSMMPLFDDSAATNTKDDVASDVDDEEQKETTYMLDGIQYHTYQDFVDAKRQRNQNILKNLGLADGGNNKMKGKVGANNPTKKKKPTKRKSTTSVPAVGSRKSSRLSRGEDGSSSTKLVALDYFVKDWNRDTTVVTIENGKDGEYDGKVAEANDRDNEKPSFYKGRLNDGADMTIEEAVGYNQTNVSKWLLPDDNDEDEEGEDGGDGNPVQALSKFQEEVCSLNNSKPSTKSAKSTASTTISAKALESKINDLSVDNEDLDVAKVTPERIYSVTAHPSTSKLIVCAGDKIGHVGIWDVNGDTGSDGSGGGIQHLVRPHTRPICCLDWISPTSLVSASYDSTVRLWDVETQNFTQLFATYDDSDSYYAEELGYGLDEGYRYWIQHVSVDHRFGANDQNPCLFLSTSTGMALHVDLRSPTNQQITFNEQLSEKKLNTLCLHRDGNTLASAGLDGTVRLWDIRKFGSSKAKPSRSNKSNTKKAPQALSELNVGYSISSSYFSPSGQTLLTTSFANRLDLIDQAHLQTNKRKLDVTKIIKHNNNTGRWLSTFMATWHPSQDVFVVGSMNKPRCIEVYDNKGKLLRPIQGDALASVMSRCAFHRSTEEITIVGGNSSGRVVAIR